MVQGNSHNIPQHHATQPRDIGINNMHNQRSRQKNFAEQEAERDQLC